MGGVALLCLLLAVLAKSPLAAVSGRAPFWALYLTLGTLFPAIVAAGILFTRSGRRISKSLAAVLIVIPIAVTVIRAGQRHIMNSVITGISARQPHRMIAVVLDLLQTFVCMVFSGWRWSGMPMRVNAKRRTPTSITIDIVGRPLGAKRRPFTPYFVLGFSVWVDVLAVKAWRYSPTHTFVPPLRLVIVGAIVHIVCRWWAFSKLSLTNGQSTLKRRAFELLCVVVLERITFRIE